MQAGPLRPGDSGQPEFAAIVEFGRRAQHDDPQQDDVPFQPEAVLQSHRGAAREGAAAGIAAFPRDGHLALVQWR